MAGRTPKPWYWESRREWCVTIKGERHRLGPDKEEADRKFHLLMAGETLQPSDRRCLYASEIADDFQVFLQDERSEATLDWYCQYLDPFKQHFMMTKADDLTADMVRGWANRKWLTQPSRRAALRAVKAAFRKAVADGRLPYSTVASMGLPGQNARDHVVRKEEYEGVLKVVKDQTFADLIRFVWLTGARPQEVVLIEKEHVDLRNSRIVMPPKLVKGKKRVRVIYLSPEALQIVKRKLDGGRLFKTLRGQPYQKDSIRSRFKRLEKKIGFRFCLYHFRHGFAHRSLAAGNDALTVATLMGHSSTETLARTYAHMNQADEHLRAALKKTK